MSDNAITPKFDVPMTIREIYECLPHREPFIFVDRVLSYTPYDAIVATKNISSSEPVLQGHFPGNPIFPGVLMVEGIAQAAGVLAHLSLPGGSSQTLLTEVTSARFRRPVVPGDVLRYDVKIKKHRKTFWWFEGEVFVGDECVAQAGISAFVK